MSDYEFTISLCIRHPGIEPSEITRALGIEPQHMWKSGDCRLGSTGESLEGTYRESYWMGRLMDEPQLSSELVSVEGVLLQTLTQLRRSQDFLTRLSESGGVGELHISMFARRNFRLELPPQFLAVLGRLGLGIALEVHSQPAHATPASSQN
jgi:Domain of unknown function (DUF4279)